MRNWLNDFGFQLFGIPSGEAWVVLRRGRKAVLGAGRQAGGDVDMGGKAAPPARDLGQVNGKAGFQERLNKRQGWPLNGSSGRRGIQGRKKGSPG